MKDERIPFPDYPAKEQEQDERKHAAAVDKAVSREIYIMRVNGDWGAIMPKRRHNYIITADKGVDLTEFVSEVRKDLEKLGLKPHFHCVRNFGIENEIAKIQDKKIIDIIFGQSGKER